MQIKKLLTSSHFTAICHKIFAIMIQLCDVYEVTSSLQSCNIHSHNREEGIPCTAVGSRSALGK